MRIIALLVAALLLALPTHAELNNPDESTPTTLYFHLFDTFNKFVVNTQGLNTEFFDVGGTNNPTLNHDTTDSVVSYDLNTMYGTSTAGPVEYQFIENGRPRFHPEAGIAQTVEIDGTVQPVVKMYLDLRDIIGVDSMPTMSPEFSMEITIREGDNAGREAQLDDGQLIMSGQQTFHLIDVTVAPGAGLNAGLDWATYMADFFGVGNPVPKAPEDGASFNDPFAGQEVNGKMMIAPGPDGVVELIIPMTLEQDVIPKKEAFNVRIDWFQMDEVFGPDAFSTGYIRHHASAEKQPRLEMNIMNPIYVEFLHPQVAAGTLLIHAGVNSPWGTYDVDLENITMTVDGPSQPMELKQVVSGNEHVHGLHDSAAEITYLWKFRDEGAELGEYTISMAVQNNANTGTAKATAGFIATEKEAYGTDTSGNKVEPTTGQESNESPLPFGLMLMGLGALSLARRRQ